MFENKYVLKNSRLRATTDLREYKAGIIQGIKSVFENAEAWDVNHDNYTFWLPEKATPQELRVLGRKIVNFSYELSSLVKVYGYQNKDGSRGRSGQLFVRVD